MDKEIVSTEVKDGVQIITYSDGSQSFKSIDTPKKESEVDTRSWWQRIVDWYKKSPVKPYAKLRDLSDPLNKRNEDPFDDGSGSKKAAEIGIRIEF